MQILSFLIKIASLPPLGAACRRAEFFFGLFHMRFMKKDCFSLLLGHIFSTRPSSRKLRENFLDVKRSTKSRETIRFQQSHWI